MEITYKEVVLATVLNYFVSVAIISFACWLFSANYGVAFIAALVIEAVHTFVLINSEWVDDEH